MNQKIDISVIIPMYNAELYIEETINSILLQSNHRLSYEVIVIDDKSTDGSSAILKKILDPRIKMIQLDRNQGQSVARNRGLSEAQGKWIQFVDSDDTIGPDLYAKFETSLTSNANCYLYSIEYKYTDYTLRQTIKHIKDLRAFALFGSVCNKFIMKELCVEFKPNYIFEDTIFLVDILNTKKLSLGLIEGVYYKYNRRNSQSITYNFNSKEYYKSYCYIFSQIKKCDDLTKMFILETFLAIIFRKEINPVIKYKIVIKTLLKLYMYLPHVILNQNRKNVLNEMLY